ncbi:putative aspartate aminotransferase [Xylaria bambusicola]|uniref:putative aspartate aminotransferase n=1 Tax=Xylaria bambusicola TaxID=326684 RepID=UPI002008B236|nr:putative aspartate aminotransferase [Xylaria bambusicola]KAI0505161.1 putative aspartate aminotransferase [Xylaria bambusicola]
MLSRRAQDQVPSTDSNVIWDVLQGQWHEQDNPHGYVNVGVAENRLMQAELENYLTKNIDLRGCVLTYEDGPVGSQRLRTALARFIDRRMRTHRSLDASQIIVTNGVSSGLEHMAWALADPGDSFLLGRPYYGEINLALRPHVRTWPVAFGQLDPLGLPAVACYERAILAAREQGTTIRGLLLCSPHNPLGRCYPREVIQALLSLCNKYQIHLISDEAYALSVWHGPPFTSVLSLDLSGIIDPSLVHVLWGISKDFGANGWRVGCIVSQSNQPLRAALGTVALYSYVSSITDRIVSQMLEDDSFTTSYLAKNLRRLSNAYTFATDFLRQHAIPFAGGTQAALFIWVDLGQAYRNRHPERAALRNTAKEVQQALWAQKVYLAWGGNFGSESPDMFRIVFAHPRSYMEEGLRRIARALESGAEGQSQRSKRPRLKEPNGAKDYWKEKVM